MTGFNAKTTSVHFVTAVANVTVSEARRKNSTVSHTDLPKLVRGRANGIKDYYKSGGFFFSLQHPILCLTWLKQIGMGGWGWVVLRRRWGRCGVEAGPMVLIVDK